MAHAWRRWRTIVWAATGALALACALLFARYAALERHLSTIQPDDSEVRVLAVVGRPSAIRRCDEGQPHLPAQASGSRRCARVYWYDAYVFNDGWLLPIDEAGYVMQVRRLALP